MKKYTTSSFHQELADLKRHIKNLQADLRQAYDHLNRHNESLKLLERYAHSHEHDPAYTEVENHENV